MCKKKHLCARSKNDGIVFYSNENPAFGVVTTLKPDGAIKSEPGLMAFEDVLDFMGGSSFKSLKVGLWLIVLLDVILIAACVWARNIWYIMGGVYFSVLASPAFYQCVSYIFAIKLGSFRSFGQFHSAEHMAVQAYEALGRIPTLDEIKKQSRISKECTSDEIFKKAFCQTIIALELALIGSIAGPWYFIALAVTIGIFYLLDSKDGYKFLQYLVTNKPHSVHLELARIGLCELERLDYSIDSEIADQLSFRQYYVEF